MYVPVEMHQLSGRLGEGVSFGSVSHRSREHMKLEAMPNAGDVVGFRKPIEAFLLGVSSDQTFLGEESFTKS